MTRRGAGVGAALMAGLFAAWTASPARSAGAPAPSRGDSEVVWRLGAQGEIERVTLRDGTVTRPAGTLPPLAAVMGPVAGRLHALAVAPDGRSTELLVIDPGSLEVRWRHEVRGAGRLLEVTPDGSTACVLAERGAGWLLHVVDLPADERPLPAGAAPHTVPLPFTPQAVTLMPDPSAPRGHRLVVASTGRLTTFALDPPAPSWFYQSPGDHGAVRPLPADRALVALRDGAAAFFEPDRRPREQGRVRLTQDDATRVVPLDPAGEDMVVLDAPLLAVLQGGGSAVSWIDARDGRVIATRAFAHTGSGMSMLRAVDEPGVLLVGAGMDANARAAVEVVPAPPIPEAPPESIARAGTTPSREEAPPGEPPEKEPVREEAPRAGPPEPAPAQAPEAEPPQDEMPHAEPPHAEPPQVESPGTEPPKEEPAQTEPPKPVPASAPPAAPREDAQPFLSGHVTGDSRTLAREALIYGPDNILKLHARVPIDAGGAFRLPLPPPGTYRILIAARPGSHLFTRPEFRSIVVLPQGAGMAGIDFEVRGAL